MKKGFLAFMAMILVCTSAFAETVNGTTQVSMSDLWTSLGVDLGSIMTNVMTTLAGPIGVVISVVFVMTILYFVVWLGKGSVKRKIGF